MKNKYIEALKRINEQIATYIQQWETPLNPKQHLFELCWWRNYLVYWTGTEKEKYDKRKKSWDEYRLLYVKDLNTLLTYKSQYATSK